MPANRTGAGSFPAVGRKAPAFTAPDAGGRTVRLADFKDRIVVLYFYPKDDTPGCTTEACEFRDDHTALTRAGIAVLGVSPDGVDSHRRFADKHRLPFALLADEEHEICRRYGVWQEKSNYGRTYWGVVRTTFVIDQRGRVAHVFEKVKPQGHAAEVLAWIREHLSPDGSGEGGRQEGAQPTRPSTAGPRRSPAPRRARSSRRAAKPGSR